MPSSQLDFESEHTVIKTNKRNDWHGYYKMRNKFFVDCVKEGETTAYQKVLTKTNGQFNNWSFFDKIINNQLNMCYSISSNILEV